MIEEEITYSCYNGLILAVVYLSIIQRTNTCCRQTESRVRSQRALWVNRWSTSQIMVWRGRDWSSTRFQQSPRCTTSNMTMMSTSMSTIWWRPPSTDCLVSSSADGSSLTRPFVYLVKCYRFQFSSSGRRCAEDQKPCLILFESLQRLLSFLHYKTCWVLILNFNLTLMSGY